MIALLSRRKVEAYAREGVGPRIVALNPFSTAAERSVISPKGVTVGELPRYR